MKHREELIVKEVNFMGDTLMAAKDEEGNIWAGVSCFCRGLGLSKKEKDRQVSNVQMDEVLKRGCLKFGAGVFDANNETVVLKLDFIPLWLAKIKITPSMKENNPVLVDKLVEYQLKAKDVLAEAFLPSYKAKDADAPLEAVIAGNGADLGRVTERIMKSQGAAPYKIAEAVELECLQFGITLPADFVKIPAYEQMVLPCVKEKE